MNNLSILNLFLNRIDRCYTDLRLIIDSDQMNCFNEVTQTNINIIGDVFGIRKLDKSKNKK